ncbi:hypothetical protein HHJ81_10505 [Mobiluncus mulieris]|uniref:Uncharacterized protein n=2 Tax=Mobiluncus mulieris TaxID=2052 RepID=E0QQ12_9ACTO|nr:hypothetical protein HMPREF0577_0292 [Mobiluncus mulieris ATCC 35243]EFM46392.1 hypothetical protein HMPREF0580_0939 [Mobiluncus mulieris ATCC 35239]MCU9968383.1 hypothetical protein [Mobiluncus mulieris]MCU9970388.1 hypothetical protein [Mobiluncus mulieris]MCU9972615.1 hypothetical protein [Mobiluncus mulieris]
MTFFVVLIEHSQGDIRVIAGVLRGKVANLAQKRGGKSHIMVENLAHQRTDQRIIPLGVGIVIQNKKTSTREPDL